MALHPGVLVHRDVTPDPREVTRWHRANYGHAIISGVLAVASTWGWAHMWPQDNSHGCKVCATAERTAPTERDMGANLRLVASYRSSWRVEKFRTSRATGQANRLQ